MSGAGTGWGGYEGGRLPPAPPIVARFGAWLSVLRGTLRADLSRPAMDRRILHRLSVMTEDELRRIGLTARDVHAARALEAGRVADFLAGRRRAGASKSGKLTEKVRSSIEDDRL